MFKVIKKSNISAARLGVIKTAHGDIETPCFMPDATRGAVKHLSADDLRAIGLECLVANTLHLFLRPGVKLIKKAGGLAAFMGWNGPVLTDSGGYQVFSLIHKSGRQGSLTDHGAVFKSPIDGGRLELTPEQSIKIQLDLGADLIVCFDDCPPNDYEAVKLSAAVERTVKWALRCKRAYEKNSKKNHKPLLFAVIQGGDNRALRQDCARELIKIGFDGYGFGARHIDEHGRLLKKTLGYTARLIPEQAPRFGLGIGAPGDIISAVKLGWDMFDCVIPTREGRHGKLFFQKRIPNTQYPITNKNTAKFYQTVNITNAKFARDFSPISAASRLEPLRLNTKAYLHYLFKIGEPLAARLASLNNLEFYLKMLTDIRKLIINNKF